MNVDTMNSDSGCASAGTNSRQGTTPMIDRLMAKYRIATATMLIRIERGITRPGL